MDGELLESLSSLNKWFKVYELEKYHLPCFVRGKSDFESSLRALRIGADADISVVESEIKVQNLWFLIFGILLFMQIHILLDAHTSTKPLVTAAMN